VLENQLGRLSEKDPTLADLEVVDRQIQIVTRKQDNLIKRLALIEDEDVAALVTAELTGLTESRRQLTADRQRLLSKGKDWIDVRDKLTDLQAWCRRVAVNLENFSYDQKRETLDALGVDVRLFHPTHQPRFEVNASIPIEQDIVSTGWRACAACGGS
jgi:uncharacterized protein YigA (DUF484 family)